MNLSQKPNFIASEKFIWGLLILVLTIWGYFSFHNWISDSEFWPITVSRELLHLEQGFQPVLFYKPIFHFSLSWLHLLPIDNITHIKAARLIYTLIGFFSFIFLFKILSQNVGPLKGFFIILTLLLSALNFSNMGAIRSDMLVTFIIILGLLKWSQISIAPIKKQYLFWILWLSLLFFTTPKATYLCLVLLISYFFISDQKTYIRLIKYLLFTFTIYIGLICLLYKLQWEVRPWEAFVSALMHGMNAQFKSGVGFSNYWLKNYLLHDIAFFILGFIYILLGFYDWYKNKSNYNPLKKSYLVLGLLLLFYVVFYEPKHLFFVASLLPVWIFSWLPGVEKKSPRFLLLSVLILAGIALAKSQRKMYFYDNTLQINALYDLDFYVGRQPGVTLLDGVGLLPRSSARLLYIGPQDDQIQSDSMRLFLNEKPDLILATARVMEAMSEFSNELSENYESCEAGLLVKAGLCPQAPEKLNWTWKPWSLFGFNNFDRMPKD